jgi:hypothetical protein
MKRAMLWIFDPLHQLPRAWRHWAYAYLTVHFGRLAIWYGIERRWGGP